MVPPNPILILSMFSDRKNKKGIEQSQAEPQNRTINVKENGNLQLK